MKQFHILLAALLAVALLSIAAGDNIIAPDFNVLSAPALPASNIQAFSIYNTGFNQLSPSEVGQTPILFAPSENDLLNGGKLGASFSPHLLTQNWTSSMQTSGINQMFQMMSAGLGNSNATG
jgi:hypothetical protein